MNYINSFCHLRPNTCSVNGHVVQSYKEGESIDVLNSLFLNLNIKYSKFHKMDLLSKTAFLGNELIKEYVPKTSNQGECEVSMLFSNRKSSATSDKEFLKSYEGGGIPSPSLFVYTLPNISIGEIAIRNKWYGENLFTVSDGFDSDFFVQYGNILLNKNSDCVMCAWLNVEVRNLDAFFFLVTKKDLKKLNLPFNEKTLTGLYNWTEPT